MSNKLQQFHKTQKFELPGQGSTVLIYSFPGAESIFPSSTAFSRVTPTRNKKTKKWPVKPFIFI